MEPNQTPIPSCVVVGGSGFVGGNIVQDLLNQHPNCKVTSLDNRSSRSQISSPNLEYVLADITSRDSLLEVFQRIRPAAVIHTASPIYGLGRDIYMKVNVE